MSTTPTDLTVRLRKLEALKREATQGEWRADTNGGCKRISAKIPGELRQVKRTSIGHTDGVREGMDLANAQLMAAAPSAITLARELHALLMECGEVLQLVDWTRDASVCATIEKLQQAGVI